MTKIWIIKYFFFNYLIEALGLWVSQLSYETCGNFHFYKGERYIKKWTKTGPSWLIFYSWTTSTKPIHISFYDSSMNHEIRESSLGGGYRHASTPRARMDQRLFPVPPRTMSSTLAGWSISHLALLSRITMWYAASLCGTVWPQKSQGISLFVSVAMKLRVHFFLFSKLLWSTIIIIIRISQMRKLRHRESQ